MARGRRKLEERQLAQARATPAAPACDQTADAVRLVRRVIATWRFIRRRFLICTANPVFLSGPGAEIGLLAAFRAERAKAVFRSPADILSASGAFDDGRHTVRQSIANGTSIEYRGILCRFKGMPDIRFQQQPAQAALQAAQRQLERDVDVYRTRAQIAVLYRKAHPQHVLVGARFGNHAQFRCHAYLHQLIRTS
ncbi:hypothetical protein P3T18_005448 [Paraburkholderia sp. GAS199]